MKILSVDLGLARTGLAICDKSELLASPLEVISEKDENKLIEKISKIACESEAERIVVGHPKNMDGTSGERADECKRIAALISEASNIDTVLWDERCTTISAHKALNVTNTRGKKRKAVIDAVAAVIILEDYLNYKKNDELNYYN